jgi:hypothetical protein
MGKATFEERFWAKVQKSDGCWLWQGCRGARDGRGLFWLEGRTVSAARIAFLLSRREDPGKTALRHKCENRLCVNPDHLELRSVSVREHIQKPREDFAARFWRRVEKGDGCWRYKGPRQTRDSYGAVRFRGQRVYTHRVSYYLSFGIDPGPLCVLHHCDTPACVRPDHLFLGTKADNNADRDSKGRGIRGVKGEGNTTAKLTEGNVRVIRLEQRSGASIASLARRFSVSESAIRHIVQGRSWRHLAETSEVA